MAPSLIPNFTKLPSGSLAQSKTLCLSTHYKLRAQRNNDMEFNLKIGFHSLSKSH